MGDNFIIIQLKTGETIVCETNDVDPFDDTNIVALDVKYPALIFPVPDKQGQIGFHKYFPFSDSDQKQEIRKSQIVSLSKPLDAFIEAYKGWLTQVKANEAGLIIPQ